MRSTLRFVFVLVTVALLGGCSLLSGSREPAALSEARARWATAGADDYAMTFQRSCFCPEEYRGPFDVEVRDRAVVSVTLRDEPLPTDRALSVDGLFALISDAYEREAATVRVTYDAALGYPTHVAIDYDTQIADEEDGYTVSQLRPE